jgi:hypothetical protein
MAGSTEKFGFDVLDNVERLKELKLNLTASVAETVINPYTNKPLHDDLNAAFDRVVQWCREAGAPAEVDLQAAFERLLKNVIKAENLMHPGLMTFPSMIRTVADAKNPEMSDRIQVWNTPYKALPGPFDVTDKTRNWKYVYQLLQRSDRDKYGFVVTEKEPPDGNCNSNAIHAQQQIASKILTPNKKAATWSIFNLFTLSDANKELVPMDEIANDGLVIENILQNKRTSAYLNHASETGINGPFPQLPLPLQECAITMVLIVCKRGPPDSVFAEYHRILCFFK